MRAYRSFFACVFIFVVGHCISQDSDPNVGKIFIANEAVLGYIYNEYNENKKDTVNFIISKDYRVKVIDRIIIQNISYYKVRVYNYYYGDDFILNGFKEFDGLMATIENDNFPKQTITVQDTAEFRRKMVNIKNSKSFNSDGPLKNIEIFNIKDIVNGSIAYKLSKPQAYDNVFLIKVYDFYSFRPYYEKNEKFINASYVNIPAKIRIKPVDLVQDFNLGINADLKMRWCQSPNNYVGLIFGINVAGIDYLEKEFPNITTDFKGGKIFLFSPNIGIYFQHKSIQFILGTGRDYISRELGSELTYQNKCNLLFGIGTNLISDKERTKSAPDTKQME